MLTAIGMAIGVLVEVLMPGGGGGAELPPPPKDEKGLKEVGVTGNGRWEVGQNRHWEVGGSRILD